MKIKKGKSTYRFGRKSRKRQRSWLARVIFGSVIRGCARIAKGVKSIFAHATSMFAMVGAMVKKVIPVFKKVFLATIVVAISYSFFLGGKYIVNTSTEKFLNIIKPENFSIKCSHIYSPAIKQEITRMVTQKMNEPNMLPFSPQKMCQHLETVCDVISHIEWRMTSPKHLCIDITGVQPEFCVNGKIVGSNRKLLDPEYFETYNLEGLKILRLSSFAPAKVYPELGRKAPVASAGRQNERGQLDQETYNFLKKIPGHYFQKYDIVYSSPEKIILNQKEKALSYSIITDYENLLDGKKIKNLALIEENMQKRECRLLQRKNLKNYRIAYDVRFENRVIVKMFRKKRSWRGR